MNINNTPGQPIQLGSSAATTEAQKMVEEFWPKEIHSVQNMNNNDFRNPELPLARIKKIMKLDEDVKMISGEAPVLFAKAVEIFIAELSLRAWVNTEDNKRRTLQRNDIAMGISKYDQFDFLIDIVPREEAKTPQNHPAKKSEMGGCVPSIGSVNISPDQLNYFLMAQHQQQQLQAAAAAAAAAAASGQPIQIIQAPGQPQGHQSFSISPQVFQLPVQSAPGGLGGSGGQADVTGGGGGSTGPQVAANCAAADIGSQTSANGGEPAKQAATVAGAAAAAGTTAAAGPIILSNHHSLQYGGAGGGEVAVAAQPMPAISLSSQQLQALLSSAQGAAGQGGGSGPIIINTMPQFITTTATNHHQMAGHQMVQAITIPTTTGSLEQQQQQQQQTPSSKSSDRGGGGGAQS